MATLGVAAAQNGGLVGQSPLTRVGNSPSFFELFQEQVRRQLPTAERRDPYLAVVAGDIANCRMNPVQSLRRPRRAFEIARRYRLYFYTTGQCTDSGGRYQVLYYFEEQRAAADAGRCKSSARGLNWFWAGLGRYTSRDALSIPDCSVNPEATIDQLMAISFQRQAADALRQQPNQSANGRVQCIRECVNMDPDHDYGRCERQC